MSEIVRIDATFFPKNTSGLIVTEEGIEYQKASSCKGGVPNKGFLSFNEVLGYNIVKVLGTAQLWLTLTDNRSLGLVFSKSNSNLVEKAGEYLLKASELTKIDVEAERNSEHRMRCRVCGHIFCYTPKDILPSTKDAVVDMISGIGGIATALGGNSMDIIAYNSTQANLNSSRPKVVDYSKCPNCGSKNIEEMTGNESSDNAQANASSSSDADEIRKFKQLLDEGIITEEEFQLKKKKILGI